MPMVKVNLIEARNLKVTPSGGLPQTYCTCYLGAAYSVVYPLKQPNGQQHRDTLIFNQAVMLMTNNPYEDLLCVAILDRSENAEGKLIGKAQISLNNLTKDIEKLAWYSLYPPGSSDVRIGLTAVDFSTGGECDSAGMRPRPKTHSLDYARVNNNAARGVPHLKAPPGASYHAKIMEGQNHDNRMASFPPQVVPSQQPHLIYPGPMSKNYVYDSPQLLLPNQKFTCQTDFRNIKCTPLLHLNGATQIRRDFPNIAKGSFGIVYTGYVQGVRDKVIIKDMHISNHTNFEDWKREVSMMNSARCPYVVEILGYSSSNNTLTIVMEYMCKGSLYDVLHARRESLSMLIRIRMARHCALGLAYLHAAGIMHRDVKSMNILVSSEYMCKFTDFGCAKLANNSNILNTANSGTPLWMAPEVRAGTYNFSADIYSLGIVFYELFERKLPQFDQTRQTVVLPAQFESSNLVLPCIDPRPHCRPNAAQLVKTLDAIIRNILNKVRMYIPPEEETLLKQSAAMFGPNTPNMTQADKEINQLYVHLLNKEPSKVDSLINMALGASSALSAQSQPTAYMCHPKAPSQPNVPRATSLERPPQYQQTPHSQHFAQLEKLVRK